MAKLEEIYESIVRLGAPSVLPSAWQHLPCHPAFFDLLGKPKALLASLQKKFGLEELQKARVVQIDSKGKPTLAPELTNECRYVLALREAPDEKPFALLVDGAILSGRYYPWSAIRVDHRVPAMLENFGNQLLVTASPADLAILWTLGIAAISTARLSDIGGKSLDSLCEGLGISRKGEHAEGSNRPGRLPTSDAADGPSSTQLIPLVFANCSLAAFDLNPIPAVAQIVEHFRKLHKMVGLDLDDFAIWSPSSDDIEFFKFSAGHGGVDEVANIFFERFEDRCKSLIEHDSAARQMPNTSTEAASELISAIAAPFDERRRKMAWDDVRRLQETELIDPLMKLGREVQDPVRRNLISALAGVSRVLHPQALAIAANLTASLRDRGPNARALLPHEELQQLLVLTDRAIVITQELQLCRSKNATKLTPLPAPKKSNTSPKSSGSTQKKSPTSGGKGL